MTATVDFKQLGFHKAVQVRDIWQAKDLGTMKEPYTVLVPAHGVVFLRVK